MNNEPFKRPTIVDASGLSDQEALSLGAGLPDHRLRTTPLVADWCDAGEHDVEFDRLISRRGSYKGGTGRGDVLQTQSGCSATCCGSTLTTNDAVVKKHSHVHEFTSTLQTP